MLFTTERQETQAGLNSKQRSNGNSTIITKLNHPTVQLPVRPGMSELLIPDLLGPTLHQGLRQSLLSVLSAHQKIIQLLSILGTDPQWSRLRERVVKGGYLNRWGEEYMLGIGVIEERGKGMVHGLCNGVIESGQGKSPLGKVVEEIRDNKANEYSEKNRCWGEGSIVHSLIDAVFLFNNDKLIESNLRSVFTKSAQKKVEQEHTEERETAKKFIQIESFFTGKNIEYELERRLEQLDTANTTNMGGWTRLGGPSRYKGGEREGRPEGYGWLMEGEGIVYRGMFRDGEFYGLGEYLDKGMRVYLGEFKKGKPHGIGIFYDFGKIVYRGQVDEGFKQGIGEEVGPNGKIVYRGYFFNNKREGLGLVFNDNGEHVFAGEFKQGKNNISKNFLAQSTLLKSIPPSSS